MREPMSDGTPTDSFRRAGTKGNCTKQSDALVGDRSARGYLAGEFDSAPIRVTVMLYLPFSSTFKSVPFEKLLFTKLGIKNRLRF